MAIKAAFLASIVLYGVVGQLMSKQAAEASGLPAETRQTLVVALAAVFAMQALFALILVPRFAGPNRRIVQMAIYEAGAIMGLVLTVLTHDPSYTLYFGLPAFVLILLA